MDAVPFTPLKAVEYDVLMLHDYSDVTTDVNAAELSKKYSKMMLVGWSMGVLMGQQLFGREKKSFQKRIAINGTLCPIDDRYGIPEETFRATLKNYNEATRLKFYRRMCKGKVYLKKFLEYQPKRDIANQRNELAGLIERKACLAADISMYTDVIISDKDFIIPTENQKRFWKESKVRYIEGTHFPFYIWKSWDEFIQIGTGS